MLAVASTPSEGVREDVALVTADGPFALVATLTQLAIDVDASGTHLCMRRVRAVRDTLCVESVEEHGDGQAATYVPRTRTRTIEAFRPSVALAHDFDADTVHSRPGLARADDDAASACPARGYAFFVTPRVTRHPVIARRLRLQGDARAP